MVARRIRREGIAAVTGTALRRAAPDSSATMAATLDPMAVQTLDRNWICGSRSCGDRLTADHLRGDPALQRTVDPAVCRTTADPILLRVGAAEVDRVALPAVVDIHTAVAVEVVADRMAVEVEEVTRTAVVAVEVEGVILVAVAEDTPAEDDVSYKS